MQCQQLNASINNDLNILLLSMNISYAIFLMEITFANAATNIKKNNNQKQC